MRYRNRSLYSFTLLLGLFFASGCSGDSSGPNTTNTQSGVGVEDNSFNPSSHAASTGQTVTWTWRGSNQHNVTWVDPDGPAASATQSSGSHTRTFSVTGTFNYYCTIHGTPTSGMRGSVVVSSGGGTAGDGGGGNGGGGY